MAEQRAHTADALRTAAQSGMPIEALQSLAGSGVPAELALPDGWEVTEYAGRGGRPQYAVYSQGRRLASGMTSAHSAARWATLLASSRLWPNAQV